MQSTHLLLASLLLVAASPAAWAAGHEDQNDSGAPPQSIPEEALPGLSTTTWIILVVLGVIVISLVIAVATRAREP